MGRLAVVLFNLGGPDRPDAVEPFLFNLFNDPAIIGLPALVRTPLARFIAWRRGGEAREIYANLGGGSPLLGETEAQARALEQALSDQGIAGARAFIAMRYWHPLSDEAAAAVKAFEPDEIILLPLYPQYSTTTTESSLGDWRRAARRAGLAVPTHAVCCYPTDPSLVRAHAALIRPRLAAAKKAGQARVLFSAHGLPKKVIAAGDPYAWQVERTAEAIVAELAEPALDWAVCYQSRVGPLEWIGPSIDEELTRAGRDGVPVVVVPIAFVSEHSETLVELDIQYRQVAEEKGIPAYERVPALGTEENFIAGLAALAAGARARGAGVSSAAGTRQCPAGLGKCPLPVDGRGLTVGS